MLSTLYSTPTPSTDNLDPATLRRASAHRLSLAPLPINLPMDQFRFGGQPTQPSDGKLSQESVQQLTTRWAPGILERGRYICLFAFLFKAPFAPIGLVFNPTSFTPAPFNHPSWDNPHDTPTPVLALTTLIHLPTPAIGFHTVPDPSPELSGIYRDMQSYVFGASSSSQNAPSTSGSASAPPNPHPFAPGPSGLRNVRRGSRHSSSATSMGVSVAAAMRRNSLYEDTDMNDLSDAGSAYSPEDDGAFMRSSRQSSFAATLERMDIDQERKLSRDMSTGLGGHALGRSLEKRRGTRHSRPGFSSNALAMTPYDADRSDEISTDEDDSNRAMERSKMRAIDDGSRRPSLPTNVHHGPDAPSHNWAQASTTAVAAPASPTSFRFGDETASARMSIPVPASPTTPTAATFSAMMFGRTNTSTGSPHLPQSQPMVSLPPLNLQLAGTGPAARSVSSPSKGSPLSPFSPSSFHTAATSPAESSESHAGRDIKTRPRSRSNRAMKPLPSFMANAGIDSSWVPPWSASSSSDGTAVARTESATSNSEAATARIPSPPPGILPPGTNPFLMSSSLQPRTNPFARRDRSATVTQQSVTKSVSPPPLQLTKSAEVLGSKQPPSSPLKTPTATSVPVNGNGLSIVNTSPSPPPEESTDPTADFDLAFILSGAEVATNDSLAPNVTEGPANYGGRKPSLAPSIEDSFIRFVNKFDDEYGERRDRWSYRLERPSHDADHQGDYWKCENMGRYWVGKEPVDDSIASAIDGFTTDNSLSIRHCPEGSAGDKGKGKAVAHSRSRSYGSSGDEMNMGRGNSIPPVSPTLTPSQRRSNVRVQVKKHHRAPAFSLYLGPRAPRALSASRPSLLLAPKAYHLHTSAPPKGKQPSPVSRPSRSGLPTSESLERVASGSLRSQSSQAALLAQARQGFPEYERPAYDSASSSGRGQVNHTALMQVDPSPVSLDLMSLAAATGRMTSVHNQAFDTLSPEDGQVVLEQLKQRSSFRIRISRAFGGMNGSSKESGAPNGSADDGSRDGRSASPHVVAVGKSHKDHHHHGGRDDAHHGHTSGPHEAAFEPPWMLMTPMYVKEAVFAAERSMYTGFASLGLAVQPSKKSKRQPPQPAPIITPAMRRNSVLDSVPNEAMCMVLPLWDLTLDLEEDKRRRRQMVDDLDLDLDDLEEEDEDEQEEDAVDEMLVDEVVDAEALGRKRLARELAKRRKLMPPPRVERKYLLAYYVPFDAKRQSLATATPPPPPPPPPVPQDHRTSKKRPRQGTNAAASRPSLQRRNSGSSATKPNPVKSFRVIARILTPAELRDSGLNPPRNIVDPKRMQQQSATYFHSSLNYHRMDRRLSSSSIFGDVVPSAFNAVIAVCNDRRRGVEFVPEGLDSLGLCGGETLVGPNGAVEKLPPLFPPAHMVPVKERLTPPLNPVGRQIVEMIWAGCLALTELGI
ncbi:hypothetical protein FRB90_012876 [Tulasnella sp. 427]|nr:hypothetical protein FRB90_012876 [Tulasnella sp. 427]